MSIADFLPLRNSHTDNRDQAVMVAHMITAATVAFFIFFSPFYQVEPIHPLHPPCIIYIFFQDVNCCIPTAKEFL